MRLSLIGMSGSGKSHWSKRLAAHGFKALHCDDLIEEKLADDLLGPEGDPLSVGQWLGFPFEAAYAEKEARYLSFENAILDEILSQIHAKSDNSCGNLIIDTTGSVIYVEQETLKHLRRLTTVVHLETPPDIREQMLSAYLTYRRPILWRGFFRKTPHEADHDALVRCYAELLSSREKLYEDLADVTVEHTLHSKEQLTAGEFLKVINH